MPKPLQALLRMTGERIEVEGATLECYAVARTARKEKPEAFQGFHSKHMLFIVDEASGVEDIIFEVGEGAMSTAGAKTLMTGNPTRTSGYFYNAFHEQRHLWTTMKVGCADSGRVNPRYIEEMKEKYGEISNVFRVRVLGEFPSGDDDSVIPLSIVEEAVDRDIKLVEGDVVWGLDVARFGGDRTALAKRCNNHLLGNIISWRGKDLMQTVGMVKAMYDKAKGWEKPVEILVDAIGMGAGVVDRMLEVGLPVRAVNVAESPSTEGRFNRKRDELWWEARDWFMNRTSVIPNQEELIYELAMPRYQYTSASKIKVESKDEMRRNGIQSPDLADAFCLTFAHTYVKSYGKSIVYPELGVV